MVCHHCCTSPWWAYLLGALVLWIILANEEGK